MTELAYFWGVRVQVTHGKGTWPSEAPASIRATLTLRCQVAGVVWHREQHSLAKAEFPPSHAARSNGSAKAGTLTGPEPGPRGCFADSISLPLPRGLRGGCVTSVTCLTGDHVCGIQSSVHTESHTLVSRTDMTRTRPLRHDQGHTVHGASVCVWTAATESVSGPHGSRSGLSRHALPGLSHWRQY